ncbi:beta-glucosidase G [Colletotrichum tofieldiae]|nr:beta-glucosidase G [Colletotrichum tofieldiae]
MSTGMETMLSKTLQRTATTPSSSPTLLASTPFPGPTTLTSLPSSLPTTLARMTTTLPHYRHQHHRLSWFDEKLEIDYRYFDAHNISVRYEFGFGLSYTTFELADFEASPVEDNITTVPEQRPIEPGGNPASGTPSTTPPSPSPTPARLTALLFLSSMSASLLTPPCRHSPKQLRGFEKVPLAVGETKTVGFGLMRRDLSYWDVVSQDWLIPTGEFTLSIGWSSRDLKAFTKITPVQA